MAEARTPNESNEVSKATPLEVLASSLPTDVRHQNANKVSFSMDALAVIGRNIENYVKADDTKSSVKEELDKVLEHSRRLAGLAEPKAPSFIILGGNGAYMIDRILTQLGWRRLTDRSSNQFKLLWSEVRSGINYDGFREGHQMVNRIPNCYLLTNKLGLLLSLKRFEQVWTALNLSRDAKLRTANFLPETYRIDMPDDRRTFMQTFSRGDIWICKPTGRNQGRGIYLVRDLLELRLGQQDTEDLERRQPIPPPMDRIVQRYIKNPLLLEGKKFDIRVFMLVASTVPFLVLYHKGYARLCLHDYDSNRDNLAVHLTNQFIQRREIEYEEHKENTVWSFEKLNAYINEKYATTHNVETDWVFKSLTSQMKTIMLYSFQAVKHKLKAKVGYFDLYGFDFLIDDTMKVWLIEVNANPCLATNCSTLKQIIVPVVQESLYLAIECFEKSRRRLPLTPLKTLVNFEVLYNGCPETTSHVTRAESFSSASDALKRLCNTSPSPSSIETGDTLVRSNLSSTEDAVYGTRKVKSVSFRNVDDKDLDAGNSSTKATSPSKAMTSSKSAVTRVDGESGLTGRLAQLGCLSAECQIDKFEKGSTTADSPRSMFEPPSDTRRSTVPTVDLVPSAKVTGAESRRQHSAVDTDKWADEWRSVESKKTPGVKSNIEMMTSASKPASLTTTVTQKPGYLGNALLDAYNSPLFATRLYSSRAETSVSTTSTLKSQPRVTMNFIPSFRYESSQMSASSSSSGIFNLSATQVDVIKREAQYLATTADESLGDSKLRALSISSWPLSAPSGGSYVVPPLRNASANAASQGNVASLSTGEGPRRMSWLPSRAADTVGSSSAVSSRDHRRDPTLVTRRKSEIGDTSR